MYCDPENVDFVGVFNSAPTTTALVLMDLFGYTYLYLNLKLGRLKRYFRLLI